MMGWPYYASWPYASYYGGWPYYPPEVSEGLPAYSEPEQQQPYYWYYCQNPQGYYPYIKSCPGGWIPVIPNVTPPLPSPGLTPPPSVVAPPPSQGYKEPPPTTQEPGTGNISPPPTTSQITPNPNQKRCQKWAPTGKFHNESSWNPQTQTMETVSVPNFDWQDYPCQ
jgi:hypothetical protein